MIHKIHAENFYSIGDKITLDFTAKSGGIEKPELYLDAPFGEKVTKIAFLGGANASGKTNILRAITFLCFIMTVTNGNLRNMIPFVQYASRYRQPTKLGAVFSLGQDKSYRYEIELVNQRILVEELYVTRFVKERKAESMMYMRKWVEKKQSYEVKVSDEFLPTLYRVEDLSQTLSDPINQRNSLIAIYSATNSVLRSIASFWRAAASNLMVAGAESDLSITDLAQEAATAILNSDQKLQGVAADILRRADIGFEQIVEQSNDAENRPQYAIRHKYQNGTRITIGFPLESTGTKRILVLVNTAVQILNSPVSSVAVLDEMDAFIHPDIYTDLTELFMSPAINENNTQLIFSSHNYTTLNQLDKQQIFLAERNDVGQTEVWRLDEMKGVEARDNFYAKYMAGKYGAVPRR